MAALVLNDLLLTKSLFLLVFEMLLLLLLIDLVIIFVLLSRRFLLAVWSTKEVSTRHGSSSFRGVILIRQVIFTAHET